MQPTAQHNQKRADDLISWQLFSVQYGLNKTGQNQAKHQWKPFNDRSGMFVHQRGEYTTTCFD